MLILMLIVVPNHAKVPSAIRLFHVARSGSPSWSGVKTVRIAHTTPSMSAAAAAPTVSGLTISLHPSGG